MQTYSFNNVSLHVNGRSIVDFSDGDDVITAARLDDAASHEVGAGGKMAIAIHADKSGTVVFRLKQTSSDNGFLYSLVNAMQAGSFTAVTVQVKDARRKDLVIGTLGYIQKPADMVSGKGVNLREWTIVSEDLIISADEASTALGVVGAALGF